MLSALDPFPECLGLLLFSFFTRVDQVGAMKSSFLVGVEYISFCHDAQNNDRDKARRLQIKLRELASALQLGTHAQEHAPDVLQGYGEKVVVRSLGVLITRAFASARS
jgi:hypothetical protein